ncbi:MAG TPA: hypothetical protein VKJ07_26080, partial [Mycobacteriales bacterium]|nr:hypothetical protein [Mycobacteriales bacterium]
MLAALTALSAGCLLLFCGVAGADTTTTTTTTTTAPDGSGGASPAVVDCGGVAIGGTISCDLGGLPPSAAVVKAVNGSGNEAGTTSSTGTAHFQVAIDSRTSGELDDSVPVPVVCGTNMLTATTDATTASGMFELDCRSPRTRSNRGTTTASTTNTTSSAAAPKRTVAAGPLVPASGAPRLRAATANAALRSTPAAANCDPSYPDFCIPSGQQNLDCDQIGRANFTVKPPDPYGFDEGDGIGCVDDTLGKDAVVPPANTSAPAATAAPSGAASAAQPTTPVASPATGATSTGSASSASSLGKTGISVVRQTATAVLLALLGYLFVLWSRRS